MTVVALATTVMMALLLHINRYQIELTVTYTGLRNNAMSELLYLCSRAVNHHRLHAVIVI